MLGGKTGQHHKSECLVVGFLVSGFEVSGNPEAKVKTPDLF